MSEKKNRLLVGLFIVLILLIDQISKFYIKLHFPLGGYIEILPWFQICFVENPGMAFGWEFFDKLFLTLFRIIVAGVMCYYLHKLIKRHAKTFNIADSAITIAVFLILIFYRKELNDSLEKKEKKAA